MIRFENVGKRYPGGNQALSEVSFELPEGDLAFLTGHSGAGKSTLLRLVALLERPSRGQVLFANRNIGKQHVWEDGGAYALLGPSGCGKTTLLNVISGLLQPTRGQVLFDGRNIGRISRRQIPRLRRQVGVIFQDHKLLSERRVFDNVALPLMIAGLSYNEIRRRVRAALDKVDLLAKERAYPAMLSGGEQQRVGIARAIVHKPPLLLADEPTGNLDPELSAELMKLFLNFNELGVTVLIASHDLELIRRLGRRVLVLRNGHMVDDIPARGVTA